VLMTRRPVPVSLGYFRRRIRRHLESRRAADHAAGDGLQLVRATAPSRSLPGNARVQVHVHGGPALLAEVMRRAVNRSDSSRTVVVVDQRDRGESRDTVV